MNNVIKLTTILTSLMILNNAFAEDFGSKGRFIIKGKLQGFIPDIKKSNNSSTTKYYPALNNDAVYSVNSSISAGNVLGVAASAAYFFSDNIAIEASSGFISQKIKSSGQGPQYDYTGTLKPNGSFNQGTKAGFIPFAIAAQYHIAPYGKLSPYFGAGYHYSFATSSSGSNIGNSRGAVFQVGVDGWIDNNMLFTAEIAKKTMNPRVTFKNAFSIDSTGKFSSQIVPSSTRVKLNPLTISIGIGIRL